ncbi:hypothetical protein DUP91_28305 [Salmonella enterica subsp. enterica]|nr:hypothetical protein [Salmonella enterica subsp. enterica]
MSADDPNPHSFDYQYPVKNADGGCRAFNAKKRSNPEILEPVAPVDIAIKWRLTTGCLGMVRNDMEALEAIGRKLGLVRFCHGWQLDHLINRKAERTT